jgi:TDG/mug DNA glycosylase family protein
VAEPEPDPSVPLAWREVHRATPVGEEAVLGPLPRPDWPDRVLLPVVEGAGFVDAVPTERRGLVRITATRAHTLPDTVGPEMHLLCVGLNPSPYAADAGFGFARPGNRFWPAALQARVVSVPGDPLRALEEHGVGMTDLVKRTTRTAAELTADEYRHGLDRLEVLCHWLRPAAVCIVGLAGWRAAVDRRAPTGWHQRDLGGRPVYVMPNPSGLNAHDTVETLAGHLRAAAAGPPA